MSAPKISIITPCRARADEEREWLREAIDSVIQQDYDGWEMVIVDDASDVGIADVQADTDDERVRWFHTKGIGAASARNQAAKQAQAELLLPLDADDKLAPGALTRFWNAWNNGGEQQGIVYSDVMKFGPDFSKLYAAPEYDFSTLLQSTYMSVGCLHRKGAWDRAQGWRRDMEEGLEDWEYWVHLGELGVCGLHVPEPLYWYRMNPRGRLRHLKEDESLFMKAYQKLRSLHQETYNGRWPMGCCGRKSAQPQRPTRQMAAQIGRPEEAGMVRMRYVGPREGGFGVRGRESRKRYDIPSSGGLFQVDPADVSFFRSFHRGRDYQVVTEAVVPTPQPKPQVQRPQNQPRWPDKMPEPTVMADLVPLPDASTLSVAAIKALELDPVQAIDLLAAEQAGKGRITAIRHLQAVAGGEA